MLTLWIYQALGQGKMLVYEKTISNEGSQQSSSLTQACFLPLIQVKKGNQISLYNTPIALKMPQATTGFVPPICFPEGLILSGLL